MRLRTGQILQIFVILITALFLFQNCSDHMLFKDLSENKDSSPSQINFDLEGGNGNGDGYTGLTPSSPQKMFYGDYLPLDAQGGKPPYTYNVTAGPGSIVLNSGQTLNTIKYLYMAPNTVAENNVKATIQVQDSIGNLETMIVTISKKWTVVADFEKGVVGEIANGESGLSFSGLGTVFTNEQVHSGNLAAKATILKGTTGFGEFGGVMHFPSNIHEGNEVWLKMCTYYPSNFKLPSLVNGLVQNLFSTKNFDGSLSKGNIGVLIESGTNKITLEHQTDKVEFDFNLAPGLGEVVQRDKWNCYEEYLKLSSVRGSGAHRVWQNGVLIYENLTARTLVSPTDVATISAIWNQFTNGAQQDQSAYVDDIKITTEQPTNTDAFGNFYIGM